MNKKIVILFFPLIESENITSNFPWALLYLERMVRHLDIEIILIDERLNKDYADVITKAGNNILFAGVSVMIGYQIVGGIKFSETVKSISNAPVIWGGWFPSVFPEMILNDGYADFVCIGQGEIPFKTFTERMIAQDNISEIPGIGFKKNGSIDITKNEKLQNPNSFPPVNLKLIDVNKLIDINGKVDKGLRSIDYIASTGCPNNCSFCNLALVFGSNWYAKNMAEIINDLKYFKDIADTTHITFSDDNFFASKKFVLSFCEELIKSGLSYTWEANAHVGYFLKNFSDDEVHLLYKSGCRRIKIGAESGSQKVLDLLNKNIQVKDNLTIVKLLKKYNIRTRLFTMVCFPDDPDEDFWQTLYIIGKAKLIDRKLDVNINFYKPIPKTVLYKKCKDHGFKYPYTSKELIDFFSNKFTAPWYNHDYHKFLDYFLNFYYLFANPLFFMSFPLLWKPIVFLLNIFLYPIIYLRFKFNFLKFPIEAILFRKIIRLKTDNNYLNTVSVYKTRH